MNGHAGPSNGATPSGSDDGYASQSDPSTSTGPQINGYAQPPSIYEAHNGDIINHLFHAGFQTGNYSDTLLHVRATVYRLHALILSRSPYLAHLMSTTPQTSNQCNIYVNLDHEPEVTDEGFHLALAYLYSSAALANVRPENARSVLAAACFLGRMDDLCDYAYEMCRMSITLDSLPSWLEFLDSVAPPSSDGSSTPVVDQHKHMRMAVFGPYAQRLRDDIFNFLVVRLPTLVNFGGQATPATPTTPHPDGSSAPADTGRETLLQVHARVPFELFKAAVESPSFNLGSTHARFKFAKDAIELRKQGIARGAEETVVLAFGGSTQSTGVLVTRKMRRRQLYKIGDTT
ncbi:uncharacterized protein BXZ73DRAFT_50772 [Epithele typhae]|uniref:uncharacterized protein n=1 Tax=Epithele typhae TaxID=378194 RepID=UPI002008D96D|nr:uncharacterized protein BXZ73DRAFT_50772 [Epithele typhae]KAH9923931.1 hypothetical protein BXZ73DRAFT_50772 [Epithele typhae]